MKNFAPIEHDPQRDLVYAAEEDWWMDYGVELQELPVVDEPVTPESLSVVAVDLITKAGWIAGAQPQFVFDVPDDDEDDSAGWHEGATGMIHLHPLMIHWGTFLHELAHFIDGGRGGHGPRYCGTHLGLVGAQFGEVAAASLLSVYKEFGVDVNERWAN